MRGELYSADPPEKIKIEERWIGPQITGRGRLLELLLQLLLLLVRKVLVDVVVPLAKKINTPNS